jgi:hypothetical protein
VLTFSSKSRRGGRTAPLVQFLTQIAGHEIYTAKIDTVWDNKTEVRESWKSRLNDILKPASLDAPGMTTPGAVGAECPPVNDPILARAASHIAGQVETIPMTLHGIEVSLVVREWSLREAFQIFCGELPPVLEKKLGDPTVREVSQRLIDTRPAHVQQDIVQNERLIQL